MNKKLPNNKSWDSYWDTNTDSRFTKKSWSKIRIIRELDKYVKKGMYVLDAGCGSGFFSNYFIEKGCKVYALDYSKEALEIARRLTRNKAKGYLNADLLDSNFPKKVKVKFDLIFSDGLFEHFTPEQQNKIIKNLKSVKKKNGIITTFVPNKFSFWEVIRPIFMPGIHERPFTMGKLKKLHKGMKIVENGGLNSIPFRFSPDKLIGPAVGMIIFVFAK